MRPRYSADDGLLTSILVHYCFYYLPVPRKYKFIINCRSMILLASKNTKDIKVSILKALLWLGYDNDFYSCN